MEIIDWTKGQADCKVGRDEKFKLVAERSSGVAEKTSKAEDELGTGLEGQDRASGTTFLELRDVDNIAGKFGNIVWRTTAERIGKG